MSVPTAELRDLSSAFTAPVGHPVAEQHLLLGAHQHRDRYHVLRCSWGNSYVGSPEVPACGTDFCISHDSTTAYGSFLFGEVFYHHLEHEGYQPTKDNHERQHSRLGSWTAEAEAADPTIARMYNSTAQCLFLTHLPTPADSHHQDARPAGAQEPAKMCSCGYASFRDFCSALPRINLRMSGDSTMLRWMTDIRNACRRNEHWEVAPRSPARGSTRPLFPVHPDAVLNVTLFNDVTLRKLYLPFAREGDKGKLKETTPSLQAYVSRAIETFEQQTRNGNDVHVYFSGNEVCPYVYKGGYKDAWRFLMEDLDRNTTQKLTQRRGTDLPAGLGLTLDSYGSQFVNLLVEKYVLPRFPRVLHLPFTPSSPAACVLTQAQDGRHFGSDHYRIAKTRLVWNMIAPHVQRKLDERSPRP